MSTPDRKKILLLTDWFYPGYKAGGPIQSCRNLIAAMESDFEFSVITGDRDLGNSAPYPGITTGQWLPYGNKNLVFYIQSRDLTASKLKQLIVEVNPDFIYLNSMFSYRFTILPLLLALQKSISVNIVLAPRGMLQKGAIQFNAIRKKLFIGLLNLSKLPRKIHFHATDQQEKEDILHFFPGARSVTTAANFTCKPVSAIRFIEKQPGHLRCVFVSRVAPKKNILFFLRLLKKLPADIRLSLSVRGETENMNYRKQCEHLIGSLPDNISVTLEGALPNDEVLDYIAAHHLFVLPTLGENFGHAIFEALAAGRPVLISDKTPWVNLQEKKAGWDIALVHEALYIETLVRLAGMSQPEYNDWCSGAWRLATAFYDQTAIKAQYKNLFTR